VPPIICIALVLRPGQDTGGARVLTGASPVSYPVIRTYWGLCGILRHGLNFSTAWCIMPLTSVEKDWKHVLMQKVITMNICCDTACLTFQLPHITTGSFQNHRRQPTTGSFRGPTFERTQQTYSQIKKFGNSQVSVVTFSGGVGKWITDCFLLRQRK